MKKGLIWGLIVLVVLVFAGCAAGQNEMAGTEDEEGEVAGFWRGLWHGIIAPFMFIVSLFKDSVGIYEGHNTGNWYNFGFMLGLMVIFGGSGGGAGRKARRRG